MLQQAVRLVLASCLLTIVAAVSPRSALAQRNSANAAHQPATGAHRGPHRPPAAPGTHAPFSAALAGTLLPSRRIGARIGLLLGADAFLFDGLTAPDAVEDAAPSDLEPEARRFPTVVPITRAEASSIQPPFRGPAIDSPAVGRVRLDVSPPTAQVYVDGFYAGGIDALPAQELTLRTGWHRVELRASGFETRALNVTVETDRVTTLHAGMRPLP